MSRKRLALLAGAGVVLVVVAVVAWTFWPRGTTEISESDALDDFRARTGTTVDGTASDRPAPVPTAGVYRYRAEGTETVKLGPFPAEDRTLPDTVTAVVVAGEPGCFDLTLNVFVEHTEDTTYCTGDGGLVLAGHAKHQQIGSLSPTARMTCDPGRLLAADTTDATPLAVECDLNLDGGPIVVSTSVSGTATPGTAETVTVGDTAVEAVPVTIAYDVVGDVSGTWTETLWLTESHLPVRIERELDLSGPANFRESTTLVLMDLTPAT